MAKCRPLAHSKAKRNAFELFERLRTLGRRTLAPTPRIRTTSHSCDSHRTRRTSLTTGATTSRTVCAPGEEHPVIEAHLTKYRSLLPTLALIFQVADYETGPVGLEAVERAAAWCALLEGHARRVYSSVAAPDVAGAKALLGKIRSGALGHPFSARDVYHRGWAGLAGSEPTRAAIALLEDLGWVRRVRSETPGRAREDVHLHPRLRKRGS